MKCILAIGMAAALFVCGCSGEPKVDATKPLEESFAQAKPETQQLIDSVNENLKAKKYNDAARALMPIVTQQPLNEEQKVAVGYALQQINQGIEADPAQDTKEMYEMRAIMFQAVRGTKRF